MPSPKRKPTSPARVAANRLNALHSSGPKTRAGKARARANAVKHGLTGAGIALPQEQKIEVEQRFEQIQSELAPQTVLGAFFAHDMALMMVRCQRAARHEAAILTSRALEADHDFVQARQTKANQLFGAMPKSPSHYRSQLLAIPEGVDSIVGGLNRLLADLTQPTMVWNSYHAKELVVLFGGNPASEIPTPEHKFSDAVLGNFAGIVPAAIAHLTTDDDRRAFCREQLVAHIQNELNHLQAHRATLDHAAIQRDRTLVAERALFDASQEAALGRKYEAASRRALYRALREFHAVETAPEAEAQTQVQAEPEAAPPTPEPTLVAEPDPEIESKPSSLMDLQPELGSFEHCKWGSAHFVSRRPAPVVSVADRSEFAQKLGPDRDAWCPPLPETELSFAVGRH